MNFLNFLFVMIYKYFDVIKNNIFNDIVFIIIHTSTAIVEAL